MATVVLLHPGAMGSRLGGELVAAGHLVQWVPEGRSAQSAERADAEGLTPVDLDDAAAADVAICSCAPQGALETATRLASAGFAATYVDANPVSPQTLADIQAALEPTGARVVDAGVIGPPPTGDRSTHLLLSGDDGTVATLFAGTRLEVRQCADASALKAAFALYNKGRTALAAIATELATATGVRAELAAEAFRRDCASLADEDRADSLRSVAYRWGPEFDEIAATLQTYGVDDGPARAVADYWRALDPDDSGR